MEQAIERTVSLVSWLNVRVSACGKSDNEIRWFPHDWIFVFVPWILHISHLSTHTILPCQKVLETQCQLWCLPIQVLTWSQKTMMTWRRNALLSLPAVHTLRPRNSIHWQLALATFRNGILLFHLISYLPSNTILNFSPNARLETARLSKKVCETLFIDDDYPIPTWLCLALTNEILGCPFSDKSKEELATLIESVPKEHPLINPHGNDHVCPSSLKLTYMSNSLK